MTEHVDDDELDGILDDALEAFDKPESNVQPVEPNAEGTSAKDSKPSQENPTELPDIDEATRALEEAFGSLAQMEAGNDGDELGGDVDENDLKILEDIFQKMGAIGNMPGDKDAEETAGASTDANASKTAVPAIEQMVESIVGHLLSEDVLKKPMMTMRDAFAKWLPENAESLSAEELGRYSKQQELIEQICERFEAKASSSEIMELLSEMQKTGQPPEAVMKEVDAEQPGALPNLPPGDMAGVMEQCGMQ